MTHQSPWHFIFPQLDAWCYSNHLLENLQFFAFHLDILMLHRCSRLKTHKRSDWLIIVIVVRSKQWSIRVWGLLWMNSVCLSVFTFLLPKTFLLFPFSHFSHDQTLGQAIIRKYPPLALWMLIFHYFMKNLLSISLQFSHPCLLTLIWVKSTRTWDSTFRHLPQDMRLPKNVIIIEVINKDFV